MPLFYSCPGCNRRLKIPSKYLGRDVACPACQSRLVVSPSGSAIAQEEGAADSEFAPPVIAPPQLLSKSEHALGMHEEHRPLSRAVERGLSSTSPPLATAPPINYRLVDPSADASHAGGAAAEKLSRIAVASVAVYPPYVEVPSIRDENLSQIPSLTRFQSLRKNEEQLRAYRIRVLRPKFPWWYLALCVLFWPLLTTIPIVVAYHLLRSRGHTLLYLTTQRLVIVELFHGVFGRTQVVLNYSLSSISGFCLFAQRGIWRLLNLLTYYEKRTFYISIITNTQAWFSLGSENSFSSDFDPGVDAVALCSELDAFVLSIKSGRERGKAQ